MRRRDLIRRIGTGGAATVGATSVTSGREATHIVWEIEGERTVIQLEEFERRSDTPSVSELSTDLTQASCCLCTLVQEGCVECDDPSCL